MILEKLYNAATEKRKLLAILIDPDKCFGESLVEMAEACSANADMLLIGGSLLSNQSVNDCISHIRKLNTTIPLVLFPGGTSQVSNSADAILFLSLISGRNADLLIGRHVETAMLLKKSGIEIIPTGYMLIDGGKQTSVSYMSNTSPIPEDKPEIAIATAVAGELLGMKLIYLENGSGAQNAATPNLIKQIKKNISVPLIVGGGIKSAENLKAALEAGADMVVVGSAAEKDFNIIRTMRSVINEVNGQADFIKHF